jgi:transcriptional regulator with XRE-family HTH domain
MKTFGSRLRHVLDTLGYNQKQFSELVKLNKNTLSNIMNDKVQAELMTKQRIYNALPNLNKEWLEHGNGEIGQIGAHAKSYSINHNKNVVSDVAAKYGKDEIKVSLTDLFTSYYQEIDLISQLLTNKQAGWKSIVESLKK